MSFQSIAGQDGAVGALRRALASDRIAHAYIFAGPPGVGKMTTARAFAQALVCRGEGERPCGRCKACGKAERGTHPDIHYVEPEGAGRQIKIEVFRDRNTGEGLLRDLSLKPYEASRKVALIDDAHAMNRESANCLLKTLEEPSAGSVLVLVTPRPDALLETILSRCHTIRFAPLSAELIEERLRAAGVAAATFLSRTSGGSLGRALAMAEDEGLPELRREVLELVTRLNKSNIVASAEVFTKRLRESTEELSERRTKAEWLLDLAVQFYRDVALRQLGAADARLFNADVLAMVDSETGISPLGIRAILDTMEEAKGLLRSNVDPEATVLDAFSRIAVYRAQRAA